MVDLLNSAQRDGALVSGVGALPRSSGHAVDELDLKLKRQHAATSYWHLVLLLEVDIHR